MWAWASRGAGRNRPDCAPPTHAVLKRGLKPSCTIVPLMKKGHEDNLRFFLSNVGRLHLAGWVCAPAPPALLTWPLSRVRGARLQGGPPILAASRVVGGDNWQRL